MNQLFSGIEREWRADDFVSYGVSDHGLVTGLDSGRPPMSAIGCTQSVLCL